MSMPHVFGQWTLSPADAQTAFGGLGVFDQLVVAAVTTPAAPGSLSCGRARPAFSPLGSNSISLPKPGESTATSANPSGGGATTKPSDFQVFLTTTQDFARYSDR